MIFNSYEFIFAFLPLVWLVYMLFRKFNLNEVSKLWLVFSSLFFYSFWNPIYLPLLLISIVFNYFLGTALGKMNNQRKAKALLVVGISMNVATLGFFKYYDFFITNVNYVFQSNMPLLHLLLPLGISFITFQKIAYLVDAYRKEAKEYNFWNYSLFVSFFPQLIAGPIVHHKDVMPQFKKMTGGVNPENMAKGLFIFGIGLSKKVILADYFAVWATAGFDSSTPLTFIEAWIASLSYTFQLYFDFSGYTDMAIGAALLFNIVLPINFNSPYKAVNIQDFWKRWHITLTRFLTHYLYIPLGGNRKGPIRTYINVFLVFFISGIWHGAGWTFIFWGSLHGIASMLNRLWQKLGFRMNAFLGWFLTFQFVNVAWVFFRANSMNDAWNVLKGMIGLNGFALPESFSKYLPDKAISFVEHLPITEISGQSLEVIILMLILTLLLVLVTQNSVKLMGNFKPAWIWAIWIAVLYVASILNMAKVSEFLYFNF